MDQNDIGYGIASMTGLAVETGLALGTINMVNRSVDPRNKKKRRARR